jgi:hypothetical protein
MYLRTPCSPLIRLRRHRRAARILGTMRKVRRPCRVEREEVPCGDDCPGRYFRPSTRPPRPIAQRSPGGAPPSTRSCD